MILQRLLPALSTGYVWDNGGIWPSRVSSSGELITDETAMTCAAVYAANRILSETVASLPLEVFRRLPGGAREPAPDHPLYRVLHDEPNPEQSSFIWRETAQLHLGTRGNAYSEIQRDGSGQVRALWGLDARRITPKRETRGGPIVYSYLEDSGGPPVTLTRDQVLHIPGMGFDGLVGRSPIDMMRNAIGSNIAAERYAEELFANSAAYNGVLQLPKLMSDKAYKRLRQAQAKQAQHGNRHKSLILEEGATWAATNMRPEDVQLIDARRFGIEEIARAYRVSLHLLMEFTEGAASYSSIVELGREFIVFTMMPWLKRWQGEINRRLLDENHFCEFNVAAFLQGDHAARAEFYTKLFQTGALTINQILERENENPIGPEGDVRFVPRNLWTLDAAIAEKDKPPAPDPFAQPAGEEDQENPAEEPEAEEPPPDGLAAARLAIEATVRETMTRLIHKEQNAMKRLGGHPDVFLASVEAFYGKHRGIMADALAAPLAALGAITGHAGVLPRAVADDYCDVSFSSMLTAAESTAAALPATVDAQAAKWEGRADEPLRHFQKGPTHAATT